MKRCLLLLLLVLAFGPLEAGGFRPILTNYSPSDYGLSMGSQVWSCSQDDAGNLYFATNKGLLIFDGQRWSGITLPDRTIIRAVRAIGSRIYVGGYEDFGYFEHDDFGELAYTSLRPLLGDFPIKNEEVWFIIPQAGHVFFQSFGSIFRFDPTAGHGPGSITPIHHDGCYPLYLHSTAGQLWAQLIDGDYCRLTPQGYEPVIAASSYGGSRVVASFRLHSGGMLLCTESEGLYLHRPDTRLTTHYATAVDEALRCASINRAIITPDSTLVIGTLRDGIYGLGLDGTLRWHYNVASGLANNSVLFLFCDSSSNVWACLDSGIALIHCGLPITCFQPSPAQQAIGTVFGVLPYHDDLLLATNEGFYRYPRGGARPAQLIAGAEGQNWHITRISSQLFLGNNRSTCLVLPSADGYRLAPVPGTEASSTSVQPCRIWGQDILIESSYNHLRIYRQQPDGTWAFSHRVEGFSSPIRHLEVDAEGGIWAANMQKGLFRITLGRDLRAVSSVRFFPSLDGQPASSATCHVMKVFGSIVMSDEQQLYTFDEASGSFMPHQRLNSLLADTRDICSATDAAPHGVWLSGQRGYALIDRQADSLVLQLYLPMTALGLMAGDRCANVCQDADIAYFGMTGGVLRCDLSAPRIVSEARPRLSVSTASYSTPDGIRQPIALRQLLQGEPVIEPNLTLLFSYADYNGQCEAIRYSLSGIRRLPVTTHDRQLTFSNLKPGHYVLQAEAISATGDVLDTIRLHFAVPQPWYLRWWSLLLYLVAVSLIAWSYGRLSARRALKRQQQQLEREQHEQRIKMLEQEQIIAEQQRQILQTELSTQSKDLATLALDVFSKEKVIENLRESMQEEQRKGNISIREMNALMRRIQQTEGNLEFWSIYQKNFDLIHEHFFRNLQERYPSLTASDLKFCALLRLNLSTKQIATFTNLSVRGVESARLRLRRKLALSPSQNLVDFLISFKIDD